MLQLTRSDFRNRVAGGWLGKLIGSTLGAPLDGRAEIHALSFYEPVPGQAAATDGLDYALVWLKAARDKGPQLTAEDLAIYRDKHLTYVWDEYGYAAFNRRRGLAPPLTGSFDNWFKHGARGLARCELWAMLAPGDPQTAATLAFHDSGLDHAEEGIWGAMFWTAMESAAFFVAETSTLLDTGLAMIPESSRVAQGIRIVRDAHRTGATPLDVRARILNTIGSERYSDAPQSVAFAVAGWLYGGGDFGACLCTAVNMGGSTQITGGALGALLGILRGKDGIPASWSAPIGETVPMGWGVRDLDIERTLTELVDNTIEAAEKFIASRAVGVDLVDSIAPAPPPEQVQAPEASPVAPVQPPSESQVAVASVDEPAAEEPSFVPPDFSEDRTLTEEEQAEITHQSESSDTALPVPPLVAESVELPSEVAGQVAATEPEEAHPSSPEPAAEPAGIPISTPVSAPVGPDWKDNLRVAPLLAHSATTSIHHAGQFEVTVDYSAAGPAILPGVASSIIASVRNTSDQDFIGRVELKTPDGWQVAVPGAQGQRQMLGRGRMARFGFVIKAAEHVTIRPKNTVSLVLTPEQGDASTVEVSLLGGSCWWWVGPFRNIASEGFEKAYEPEDKPGFETDYLARDGGLTRWQKRAFGETVIPLESYFNGVPGVAYGLTNLHSVTPTEARIVAHTNDGVRVWLNGQPVLRRHSHEPFRPTLCYGPASADVTLKAGDNKIMIKVVRCDTPLQFAFSVCDRQGNPLSDPGNCRW